MKRCKQDVGGLRDAARGHWAAILHSLGGIDEDYLDGKHHPCPKCGGVDRFRFSNMGSNGSVYCNQCGKGIGDGFATLEWLHGWSFAETVEAVARHLSYPLGGRNGKRSIAATYDYRDETGELLFQVVRFEPKEFRQRRPDGDGGWAWKTNGVRLVPYRLPELVVANATRPVFVVEGEKDADRLAALGAVATTNARGAGKWRSDYTPFFHDRPVVILPDNDDAGREHAAKVAASLHGVARAIKIVVLPDLPTKGDVSDWLDAGGTVAQLADLVRAAPIWKPSGDPGTKAVVVVSDDPDIPPPGIEHNEGRTEVANGKRFAQRFAGRFRWCPPMRSWFVWDGRRWAPDNAHHAEAAGKEIYHALWQQLAEAKDVSDETIGTMVSFTKGTGSAKGIENMLKMARSERQMPVVVEALDSHPWLLNVENGTIDLRNGSLRPHSKEDRLTKLAPVIYNQDATCPTWQEFLYRIMGGNVDLIDFLQRAVGMSLTGIIRDHALLVLYGTGQNGKSTFLTTLQHTIGLDYSIKAPLGMLMAKQHEQHPTEIADLRGRRLVACIEVEEGARLAESLVKELTGGDRVRARFMRQDFFEFDPTHHIWLATNHRPEVRGTDTGIWRRIKLIPFTVSIPEAEQDKELSEKLNAERPGILAWAVRGAVEWASGGLREPPDVLAATAEYRSEQDVLATFLADCCEMSNATIGAMGYSVSASALFSAYDKWCEQNGEFRRSAKKFGIMIAERGIRRDRDGRRRKYLGVRLKSQSELDQDEYDAGNDTEQLF